MKQIDTASNEALKPFQCGDLDSFGDGVYAALNAFQLALVPHSGLTHSEAQRVFRLAVKHHAERRSAIDTFLNPVAPRRAMGLARLMARALGTDFRQVRIDQPPTSLNASMDDLWQWIEDSLSQAMPIVAMLEGQTQRYVAISGANETHLTLFGSGDVETICREECGLRQGIYRLSATNMFRVRVLALRPIFELAGHIIVEDCKLVLYG